MTIRNIGSILIELSILLCLFLKPALSLGAYISGVPTKHGVISELASDQGVFCKVREGTNGKIICTGRQIVSSNKNFVGKATVYTLNYDENEQASTGVLKAFDQNLVYLDGSSSNELLIGIEDFDDDNDLKLIIADLGSADPDVVYTYTYTGKANYAVATVITFTTNNAPKRFAAVTLPQQGKLVGFDIDSPSADGDDWGFEITTESASPVYDVLNDDFNLNGVIICHDRMIIFEYESLTSSEPIPILQVSAVNPALKQEFGAIGTFKIDKIDVSVMFLVCNPPTKSVFTPFIIVFRTPTMESSTTPDILVEARSDKLTLDMKAIHKSITRVEDTLKFFIILTPDLATIPSIKIFMVDGDMDEAINNDKTLKYADITESMQATLGSGYKMLAISGISDDPSKLIISGITETGGFIQRFDSDITLDLCFGDCKGCTGPEETACFDCFSQYQMIMAPGEETGRCIRCHPSCEAGCSGSEMNQCLICDSADSFFYKEDPNKEEGACLRCHENCDGCSESRDPERCLGCVEGLVFTQRQGEVYGVCAEEGVGSLAQKTCFGTSIPGCEKCSDVRSGCEVCQAGAGIQEDDEGLRKCIVCPMQNCEECKKTPDGRQCQKCFDGFDFNEGNQECEFDFLVNISLVFLFLGFLIFK